MKKIIDDLSIKGKRVLVRVDFNVPLEDGKVTDDLRIRATLPTIKKILAEGGSAILMSHLGRPKGVSLDADKEFTLEPIAVHLSGLLGRKVKFVGDCVGPLAKKAAQEAKPGDVILLENLRFHKEETKGDEAFARTLASHGDLYVNDAFGTCHRAHASVAIVPRYLDSAAGYLVMKEIEYLDEALKDPARPFIAILGGAKVSDKLPVIKNLLGKVDGFVIGGAMAYTFLSAKGVSIGSSLVEKEFLDTSREILQEAERMGKAVYLPVDHVVAQELSADAETKIVKGDIPSGWMGLDIGPETREEFSAVVLSAGTVVWNGPMGVFEMDKFSEGTRVLAQELARSEAISIIGGGDSAAAVMKFGLSDRMTHISTGGGASLEFLEGKELPGIAALPEKEN